MESFYSLITITALFWNCAKKSLISQTELLAFIVGVIPQTLIKDMGQKMLCTHFCWKQLQYIHYFSCSGAISSLSSGPHKQYQSLHLYFTDELQHCNLLELVAWPKWPNSPFNGLLVKLEYFLERKFLAREEIPSTEQSSPKPAVVLLIKEILIKMPWLLSPPLDLAESVCNGFGACLGRKEFYARIWCHSSCFHCCARKTTWKVTEFLEI